MSLIDKTIPLKERINHVVYGNMSAVVYSAMMDMKMGNLKDMSIESINKNSNIKWWTKQTTKKVMEER